MFNRQRKKLEEDSRALFHELHKSQAKDDFVYSRLVGLLSEEHLEVEKDFFKGKVCLDAGCGSNANASLSMLKMGCKKVYPMDLDDTIFEIAPELLKDFDGSYELKVGSVLDLPFENDFFDFTHCAGVLHHTADVKQGIKELVRVTKPGSHIQIETFGKDGLVRDITTLLRNKYKSNKDFANLIEKLSHKDIQEFIDWTFLIMLKNGDEYSNNFPSDLSKTLFDEDLVLTIKDRIMAPVYHENSEQELTNWLKEFGCIKIKRLTRYPVMKNFRRFLAPMYSEYQSKYARLLYGDGNISLKGIKPYK